MGVSDWDGDGMAVLGGWQCGSIRWVAVVGCMVAVLGGWQCGKCGSVCAGQRSKVIISRPIRQTN